MDNHRETFKKEEPTRRLRVASAAAELGSETLSEMFEENFLMAEAIRVVTEHEPADSDAGGDSLSLYLREIRAFPLLSKDDEAGLGAQIEEGQKSFVEAVFSAPVAVQYVAELAQRVKAGESQFASLVVDPEMTDESAPRAADEKKFVIRVQRLCRCAGDYDRMRSLVKRLPQGTSEREKEHLAKRLSRKKKALIQRVEDLGLSWSCVEKIGQELKKAARELENIERLQPKGQRKSSRVQEVEATVGMRAGELKSSVRVMAEAEQKMARARKTFTESNLRLVVNIAKRYANLGLDFPELIQEGNIGLMRATERFDHRLGWRFSTYAHWWIRQAIRRALVDRGHNIRIPVHVVELKRKLIRASQTITEKLHREPSPEELARVLNSSVDEVQKLLNLPMDPVSLDAPVRDEGESRLQDMVEDSQAADPIDEVAVQQIRAQTQSAIAGLPEKEREVIRKRFGIGDNAEYTLQQLGDEFSLSRERIRQLETRALRRLRFPLDPGC